MEENGRGLNRTKWQYIAFSAITLWALAAGFFLIYSYFPPYDDEGYLMITVKQTLDGGILYDEVYTQYGPVYYIYRWILSGVFMLPITHDATRLSTLVVWILTALGSGVGDELALVDDPAISGQPVLLVNPLVAVPTGSVFAAWDGVDRGPLDDWREGRNDLETPARAIAPVTGDVLDWLGRQEGATFVRMTGSGATCFALFVDESRRDRAQAAVPADWWRLATFLR